MPEYSTITRYKVNEIADALNELAPFGWRPIFVQYSEHERRWVCFVVRHTTNTLPTDGDGINLAGAI